MCFETYTKSSFAVYDFQKQTLIAFMYFYEPIIGL